MEGTGKGAVADASELARRPDVDVVPTAPEETDLLRARRARMARRLFVTLLAVFLMAGLTGRLGVKSRSTTARGGGYELTVTYAQTTRWGLATPWSFEVHRPGGFEGPITVSTTTSYLDPFDENGFEPEPTNLHGDARRGDMGVRAAGRRHPRRVARRPHGAGGALGPGRGDL